MHLTVARVTRREAHTHIQDINNRNRAPFSGRFRGGKVERMEECEGRRDTYTDRLTDMVDGIGRLEAVSTVVMVGS